MKKKVDAIVVDFKCLYVYIVYWIIKEGIYIHGKEKVNYIKMPLKQVGTLNGQNTNTSVFN